MAKPTRPRNLGRAGSKLWRSMVADYDFRPDELVNLEAACREADVIDRLQAAIDEDGFELTVAGSMGQPVANPLLAEVRQHRSAMRQLLAALSLPDDAAAANRSSKMRGVAAARWSA